MGKKACKSESNNKNSESAKYKCKKCGVFSKEKDHLCKPQKQKKDS